MYELCKKLKEAGFPQECKKGDAFYYTPSGDVEQKELVFQEQYATEGTAYTFDHHENLSDWYTKCPSLEDIIEACGEELDYLDAPLWKTKYPEDNKWMAIGYGVFGEGDTLWIAVCNLWLALQDKK